MNTTHSRKLLTTLLCGGLLLAGSGAEARGGDDREYRGRGWDDRRHEYRHHDRHHDRHQYRGHYDSRTVIRERVVIREAPRRYREREVREYHYTQPYPSYGYGGAPAIVIGIGIPPIVIPLR